MVSLIVVGGLWFLRTKVRIENKSAIKILLSGFVATCVGLVAYVVLGFFWADLSIFQSYFVAWLGRSDWYSRHQTLQPLGVALLIVGATTVLSKQEKFLKQIQIVVVSVCVVFNLEFGFEYVVDHAKQREVVAQLKNIGESKSISGFEFIDQTEILNARGRLYRYRDWYGLISLAYDSKLKYGTDIVIENSCSQRLGARLVLIDGPETHLQALKNWASKGDMGFDVIVDDTPGACKPEMVRSEIVSGAIPILFYFTGAKN